MQNFTDIDNKCDVCAFCGKAITESNRSKEHIIPNALGGRRTVDNFICKKCNNHQGLIWDNELVKNIQPLCTMFRISRQRGKNPPITVKTTKNEKLIIHADGKITNESPIFLKQNFEDRTEITIQARNMKEFKEMIMGLGRKNPEINVDKILENSSLSKEFFTDPYAFEIELGSEGAIFSIIKSCLALAYEAGITIDDCEHAKELFYKKAKFGFHYITDDKIVKKRPKDTVFHAIHIDADSKYSRIMAYVEYFSWLRAVVCLSNNYNGEPFSHSYVIDPVSGRKIELEFDFKLDDRQWRDIIEKEFDIYKMQRNLGFVIDLYSIKEFDRVKNREIDEAIEEAYRELGIEPETVLSEHMAKIYSETLVSKLMPFMEHISFGRLESQKKLKELANELQKRDNK